MPETISNGCARPARLLSASMAAHSERRTVPYSPQQMYDLVADVESYPEFIPWIEGARVRSPRSTEKGAEFEADLVVSFKVFRERYTSRVKTFPPENHDPARIDVEAISGPFDKLITRYAFHQNGAGGCEMVFNVDFAFKNRLLQRVAGAAFDLALRRIAAAFETRAKSLYGADGVVGPVV